MNKACFFYSYDVIATATRRMRFVQLDPATLEEPPGTNTIKLIS